MYSTRNNAASWLTCAAALALGAAGAGCNIERTPTAVVKTPVALADQPRADEATELRNFPKSVALYHSGATQAWPTRWYYKPNPDYTTVENFAVDPLMFGVQTVSLLGTLIVEPPFMRVYYVGDLLPPSYTGMPALPPTPVSSIGTPNPDPLAAPREPVTPPLPPIPIEQPPMIYPPAPKPAKGVKPATMKTKASPTTRPAH